MTSTGQVAGAHQVGTVLGKRFKVEKVLGRGGFAITYLCRAGTFNKPYAVKEFLPIQLATRETDRTVHPLTEEDREMFERGIKDFLEEGRRLQLCEHKHVVKVEDFFNEYGTAYLVMEYIQGETLSARLKKSGALSGPDVIRLMMPALDALAAVHKSGLLHRDLSPSNIMLRGDLDDPVLIDFGASRYSGSLRSYSIAQITNDGFSSPEHYDVKAEHTPPTDIHSVGAICYNLLTGERPPSAIDRKIGDSMGGWGDRFRGLKHKLLVPVIDKAMSLMPKDRYQTVGELQTALAGVRSTWDGLEMASRSLLEPSMMVLERSDGTVELRGTAGSAALAAELVARLQAAVPGVKVRDALEIATSTADKKTMLMPSEGATVLASDMKDMTAPLAAAVAPVAAASAALASVGALWARIEGAGSAADPIKLVGVAASPEDKRNALDAVRRVIAGAPLIDQTEVATSLAGAADRGNRDTGPGPRVDIGPNPPVGSSGHFVGGGGGSSAVPELERGGKGKAIGLSLAALLIASGLGAWSLGLGPFAPTTPIIVGGNTDPGGINRPVGQGGTGDPRPQGQVVPPVDQGGTGPRIATNDQRPVVPPPGVQPPISDIKPNAPEVVDPAQARPVPPVQTDAGPVFRPVENPFNVQIELAKTRFRIGEPLTFTVRAGRDCNFLVYTVSPEDKVELHDPKAAADFMGAAVLTNGEVRQIPVPTAPGVARVRGPVGTYQIGAVCSEGDLARVGITTTELREPARQGRRSFEFKLEQLRQKINRGELSLVTVQYAVTE